MQLTQLTLQSGKYLFFFQGFRYFSMYMRGREELLLKVLNEQVVCTFQFFLIMFIENVLLKIPFQ